MNKKCYDCGIPMVFQGLEDEGEYGWYYCNHCCKNRLILCPEDQKLFVEALLDPSPENAAMKRARESAKKLLGKPYDN